MSHKKQLAGAAAGTLSCLSLIAFAPPVSAAEGADLGRARNDIGNFQPGPVNDPSPTSTGFDTSDALVATVAGLLVAGGGIGAVVSTRRRHLTAHHPA